MDGRVLVLLEVIDDIIEHLLAILKLGSLIEVAILKIELANVLQINSRSLLGKYVGEVGVVNEEVT